MNSTLAIALILGYFLGSIPFSHIIAKAVKGVDLRKTGSLNVGARNLTQTLGPGWGLLGGLLDFGKGCAAMWAAERLGVPFPASLLAGAAAVAGHNFPIWLGFRGGKGLATALGVIAPLAFKEALASFGVWVFVLRTTRNVIVASVAAFSAMLILLTFLGYPIEIAFLVMGLAGLILLSALPDMLERARTTGSVENYLRDPELLQKDKKPDRKP